MALDLTTIGLLAAAAAAYVWLPGRWRGWAILVGSVAAVYGLQPTVAVRYGGYLLPTFTVGLAVLGWALTRPPDRPWTTDDRLTAGVIVLLVVGMSGFRYVDFAWRWTAGRPPALLWVVAGLGVLLLGGWLFTRAGRQRPWLGVWLLVGLFVLLKTPALTTAVAAGWRWLVNQDVSLAAPTDLGWLGFSHVAFRLLHTVRDRQQGRLPALSLRAYVSYIVFAPAFIAGPIDRAERFGDDWRQLPDRSLRSAERVGPAVGRIAVGLGKKFVLADGLALGLALNAENAAAVDARLWLWVLLYGYAFRLYFDFAGYTDIAIGLGMLFGIDLPENFDRPYTKTNLAAFWQSWHITLSDWARFYVFSPLSRSLLRRKPRPSPVLIVFTAQMATMITIGLWHGVTGSFLVWGVWHGVGLFVHKQWSDRTRKLYRRVQARPWARRVWAAAAWAVTFHFVVVGWVWFLVPEVGTAVGVLWRLWGG